MSGKIVVGDTITFANRPRLWRRVFERLGLMKPRLLQQFVVTQIVTTKRD